MVLILKTFGHEKFRKSVGEVSKFVRALREAQWWPRANYHAKIFGKKMVLVLYVC